MIVLCLCVNVKEHLLPLFMTLEMGWYFSGINFATEKYSCWFNWYCCKLCSPAISLNGFGFIIQCFCSLYILRWIAHKWDWYSKFFHRCLTPPPPRYSSLIVIVAHSRISEKWKRSLLIYPFFNFICFSVLPRSRRTIAQVQWVLKTILLPVGYWSQTAPVADHASG